MPRTSRQPWWLDAREEWYRGCHVRLQVQRRHPLRLSLESVSYADSVWAGSHQTEQTCRRQRAAALWRIRMSQMRLQAKARSHMSAELQQRRRISKGCQRSVSSGMRSRGRRRKALHCIRDGRHSSRPVLFSLIARAPSVQRQATRTGGSRRCP